VGVVALAVGQVARPTLSMQGAPATQQYHRIRPCQDRFLSVAALLHTMDCNRAQQAMFKGRLANMRQ
jgi:hypothetical protein